MKNLTKIPSYKLLTFFEINKKNTNQTKQKEKVNRRRSEPVVCKDVEEGRWYLNANTLTQQNKRRNMNINKPQ